MMKNKRIFNTLSILGVSVSIFLVLVVLLYTGIIDEYNGQLLTMSGIYLIISLSLNLITGFTGQLALGQAGFMCIGAYSAAISMINFNVPLLLAIIIGGIVTAVFGFVIGFPTLRLRGDYLAITTLGFGEIIRVIMINLEKWTGGPSGLENIPSFPETQNFVIDGIIAFSYVFVFVVICIVIVSNLIKSSPGRAIVSIREDEIASNSMGINVAYYKMFAFIMSAFLAGVGGGLYACFLRYLNPSLFGFLNSVNFVVIVVLGGLGSITGTIFSSIAFVYIQEWLRIFKDFRLVIFGGALIAVMLFWPRGLMGTAEYSPVRFVKRLLAGEYSLSNISEKFKKFITNISDNFKRFITKIRGIKNKGVK